MYKRSVIATALLTVCATAYSQAYRWVDEDGVVHFSDRPHPGAEEIELPKSRPAPQPVATYRSAAVPREQIAAAAAEETFRYDSLSVGSPIEDETIWNIEGVLAVSLDLQPSLQPGHRLMVYFDGQRQQVSGTSFQLQEVWRGTHSLQAEVLDATGKLLIRSKPTTFHVQQNSILRPRPN